MPWTDTYQYQEPDMAATNAAVNADFADTSYAHEKNKRWYKKYRSWADYWRTTAEGALVGTSATQPTDPLAQLQKQLLGQYEKTKTNEPYAANFDFGGMINARNQGSASILNQRAAGMGVQGAYQPTVDAASRARQTLVD